MREVATGAKHSKTIMDIGGNSTEAVQRDGVILHSLLVSIGIHIELVKLNGERIRLILEAGFCANVFSSHCKAVIGNTKRIKARFKSGK